jgi:hypothetical protein
VIHPKRQWRISGVSHALDYTSESHTQVQTGALSGRSRPYLCTYSQQLSRTKNDSLEVPGTHLDNGMTQDMKNIWYIMNRALVRLALLGGYNSQEPQRLRNTNPDAIVCGSILFKYVDGQLTPLSKLFKTKEEAENARLKLPERERREVAVGVIRIKK